MDDLRWILLVIGLVVIAAIYLSGRFEREEWKRDREGFPGFPKSGKKSEHEKMPASSMKEEPQISIPEVEDDTIDLSVNSTPQPTKPPARENIQSEVKPPPVSEIKKEEKIEPVIEPKPVKNQSVGIRSEEDVIKALGLPGQDEEETVEEILFEKKEENSVTEEKVKEKEQVIEDDWKGVIDSTKEPLIEDEIVDIAIPDEEPRVDKKPEQDTRPGVKAGTVKPLQQELLLEIEPLVLVLTIMAKGEDFLEGKLIRRVLDGAGLKCDENGIFQFHMTGKKDAVFSIVSAVEPGVFDVATIDKYKTPGLSCFCQLPGPLPNKDLFRIMQMKALNIAEKLGAKLCDDRRNLLTEQAITHYNDRITEFDREMVLAKKKQG